MKQDVAGHGRLRAAFQSLAEGSRPTDECPAPSRFWDAQRGDVSAADARQLMDHVASCPSCAEAWRLARELDDGGSTGMAAETASPQRLLPMARSIMALAAVVLLAVAVSAGYLLRAMSATRDPSAAAGQTDGSGEKLRAAEARITALEQQIARLSSTAQVNVPFIELQPEPLRGVGRPVTAVEIPDSATVAVLILATDGIPAGQTHRVELIEESGRVTWSASDVRAGSDGAFTAVVPVSQLPGGTSRLLVLRDRAGERAVVQEYRMRITYGKPSPR